jgi:superfamily II DNA/RNA helicase
LTTSFSQLGVSRQLTDVLASRGLTAPFPIQTATVPEALAGRDLCGRAPTGSGKTLAFSIPVAANVGRGKPHRPRALILVPTRELATQVAEELRPLAEACGRSVATFYGGTNLARDQRCLKRGIDIAIACPGRLADLVRRRDADLRDVDLVVIDEADRMADMGFLPEVKRLLDATSDRRQTLLFSATLDGDVDVLIRRYQRDPVRHEMASAVGEQGDVRHFFWHAEPTDRVRVTREVLGSADSAIVFTRTKHAADRVAKQLSRQGVRAAAIHGNRSQNQRERALADFSAGRVTALVATDVAARGIHVDKVGVVVHFDPPATDKDYVHRSGRTGRAGEDGLVVTLVAPDKVADVKSLQRALAMRQRVTTFAVDQLHDAASHGDTLATVASAAPAPVTGQRDGGKPRAARSQRGGGQRGHGAAQHRSGRRQGGARAKQARRS